MAVPNKDPMTAAIYELKIKGYLDQQWSEWLGDLKISYDDEENTILSGHIADHTAGAFGVSSNRRSVLKF